MGWWKNVSGPRITAQVFSAALEDKAHINVSNNNFQLARYQFQSKRILNSWAISTKIQEKIIGLSTCNASLLFVDLSSSKDCKCCWHKFIFVLMPLQRCLLYDTSKIFDAVQCTRLSGKHRRRLLGIPPSDSSVTFSFGSLSGSWSTVHYPEFSALDLYGER